MVIPTKTKSKREMGKGNFIGKNTNERLNITI